MKSKEDKQKENKQVYDRTLEIIRSWPAWKRKFYPNLPKLDDSPDKFITNLSKESFSYRTIFGK